MPFLSKKNPYNAGYNVPQSVLREPWWRGVRVTTGLARRSISPTANLAPPWHSDYAVPSSVERPGVMPHLTKYTRRDTIADTIPAQSWLEGTDMDNGSLSSGARNGILGSREGQGILGSTEGIFGQGPAQQYGSLGGVASKLKGDPVAAFGREGAKIVLGEVRTLTDPAHRKAALRAILEGIESSLWVGVEERAAKLKTSKGYDAATALEKAIAIELSNRYLGQVIKLGKTGQAPTRGPLSLAYAEGLGACTCATQESLGFSIGGAFSAVTGGAAKVVGAAGSVAKVAGSVAGTALNKLGSLACAVGSSSALKTAVVTAAMVKGGQAGAAAAGKGAAVASKICAANPKAMTASPGGGGGGYAGGVRDQRAAPAASKFPLVPVLIGGGALLAAVLLLKKKA